MDKWMGMVEMGLFFGGLLAILIWQWFSIRGQLRRDEEEDRRADP